MNKENKIIEELYEEKPFIVPNGGDIQKVEITYNDWVWIEQFLLKALATQRKEMVREIGKIEERWLKEYKDYGKDSYEDGQFDGGFKILAGIKALLKRILK